MPERSFKHEKCDENFVRASNDMEAEDTGKCRTGWQ